MRYNMLGAPQAKILWSAPSKSRFYYLFWLLELMPGHLRRSILWILVLNPTHEISWSRSGFFSLRGRILRAGPPGPLCFLVFVFSPPPSALEAPGRTLSERSKTLRPVPFFFSVVCVVFLRFVWSYTGCPLLLLFGLFTVTPRHPEKVSPAPSHILHTPWFPVHGKGCSRRCVHAPLHLLAAAWLSLRAASRSRLP